MQKIKDFSNFGRILLVLIALDSLWIGLIAKSFYQEQIGLAMKTSFSIWIGIAIWVLIALGLTMFVLPVSKKPSTATWKGGVFGLILYGVYDLTNYLVLNNWGLELTIVDIIWGVVLCSFLGWIGAKTRE